MNRQGIISSAGKNATDVAYTRVAEEALDGQGIGT
jgi:hypothetical protein